MEMFRTVRVIFVSVRTQFSSRLPLLLIAGMILMALPPRACAQDDRSDTPLGDVARNFRKKPSTSEVVIDNDNFSKVVEDAESRRTSGSTMVFSLDPGGKQFHVSSPDVSCSLSFSGKTSSLLSDPAMLDELPRNELAKLDGPATIDGDSLQVSVHNGTSWELREVVIGLTILRQPEDHSASSVGYRQARIVPVTAGGSAQAVPDTSQKQPDSTVLLRVKGSAAPSATALFRTQLNFALFPDQEWHWAIVRAKGVPPPPAVPAAAQPEQVLPQSPALPEVLPAATQNAPSVPPTGADVPAH